MSDDKWKRFYAATGDEPRETLLWALELHEAEGRPAGKAVDLGFGSGRDSLELLRRGWRVFALDSEPAAVGLLRSHPDAVAHPDALETVVARFGEHDLPRADLVNASLALPFCPPETFERLWESIRACLSEGGRFCGQLFGERDEWASESDMNFHARGDVEVLLEGLEVERLEEVERDGYTALGRPKHHHLFHIVARQP